MKPIEAKNKKVSPVTYAAIHYKHGKKIIGSNPKNGISITKKFTLNKEAGYILYLVSEQFGISVNDIKSKCRKREFVDPRHAAMYLMRKHLNMLHRQIKCIFNNNSDHSTVIYACEKVADLLITDYKYRQNVEAIEQKLNC